MPRNGRDRGSEICKAFGVAVRARREELGLSQEELGFKAGLHRTYVGDVERGERNPTLEVVGKLAGALETEPRELLLSS